MAHVDAEGGTVALPDVRLSPGQTFAGRYAVLGVLGEGGMGAVYRVRDTELDEEVALKVLRPEIAESRDAIERFRREVKLARKVTHPNVARTYDLGAAGGTRFLTMELIDGPPLSTRTVAGRRLSLADALRVTADVCRGLAAAHAVGVVHRDLKPDNILLAGGSPSGPLTGAERPVITDFGIARLSNERAEAAHKASHGGGTAVRQLTVGAVLGTPAYMAPEQVLGQDPDGRADVYALGVVLFELLTGRMPFEADTAYATAAARLTGTVPDVREYEGAVPDGVAALVAQAMATRREDRPDAARMLESLEQLRGAGGGQFADRLGAPGGTFGTGALPLDAQGAGGPARPRSLAVLPFTAQDAEGAALARDLAATLADAVSRLRALRVIPPAVVLPELAAHQGDGGVDVPALARALRADRVLAGTLRTAGARVRVNLRMIDPAGAAQVWGERFDGDRGDPFALEDALVRGAEGALRAALGSDATGGGANATGPTDAAARALYDRARELYNAFGNPTAVGEAVELLRRAHAAVPHDASVMSLLGAALVRLALLRRDDPALMSEAEDQALRALDADPSLGETYATLGLVRLHQGQLKNAVRAFREAVARNPRHAEAVSYLGRFLAETGHLDDGIKRLEFALRLDPQMQRAWSDLVRLYALRGDRERTAQTLERAAAAIGDPAAAVLVRARQALWSPDPADARALVKLSESVNLPPQHPVRVGYVTLLNRIAAGEPLQLEDDKFFDGAASFSSLTNRAFMYQLSAEIRSRAGALDAAIEAVEQAAALPFVDVTWMDLCPPLAPLRPDPRFARLRAAVAARAQDLWT